MDRLIMGAHEPPANLQVTDGEREERKAGDKKALETFLDLLRGGGAQPVMVTNIVAERWRKNLW